MTTSSFALSIITPSYNQAKFIERTLQSVLSQQLSSQFGNIEYVVVDGGSDDGTVEILNNISQCNPARAFKFVSEKDRGQAHALNKGIAMTSGEIIGWLNSDDIYYPNTLQSILEFFQKNPHAELVYGQANHIDEDDRVIALYPTEEWSVCPQRLLNTCFISQPAVFFKRSLITRFGLIDESLHFCMDYEFWLRLATHNVQLYYLKQVLAGSRLYPQTKTLSSPLKAAQETLSMLKQRLGYVPLEWLIQYAVIYIKNKTSFRMPQIRFIFSVAVITKINAFKWNGVFRGMLDCVKLPVALWKMSLKKV